MKKNIVVITSHYFYQPAKEAFKRLNLSDYEITITAYDNFEHISRIYEDFAANTDGFLVSGESAKHAIELSSPSIKKPIIPFQVDSDTLYKDILLFLLENQHQDFSRIALDFLMPFGDEYSVLDFVQLREIDSFSKKIQKWVEETGVQEIGGVENVIMAKILDLWVSKKIDMVICVYSSIIPALTALNIPYRCPFVSDQHLENLLHQLDVKAELQQMRENLPAIIKVVPQLSKDLTPKYSEDLGNLIHQYLSDNMLDCVLQENDGGYMLFTTLKTLRYISNDYESCSLCSYINSNLEGNAVAGCGIGSTINHALNNLQTALREAKFTGKSYIKDENGNLIGPLDSEYRMVVDNQALPDVSKIAKRCSLSPMTIKKLFATMQRLENDKITASELAKHFGITIRNSNRILMNLKAGGVAIPIYTQTGNSRGRPIQIYQISFKVK